MLGMCKIEGCDAKPVAKGLCAKHYMRQRRHGDAAVTGKPGPKPNEAKVFARNLFRDWSPRTLARYEHAMRMANKIAGVTGESAAEIIKRMVKVNAHKSGNGNFSVAGLEASIEFAAIKIILDREAAERGS